MKSLTHLEILEEDGIPRPVHLRKQVLVQDFAHQLEQIHLALVVRLVLQQREELGLPLPVVHRLDKLPDHRRHSGKDVAAVENGQPQWSKEIVGGGCRGWTELTKGCNG